MPKFDIHSDVITLLEEAQSADQDLREHAREAHDFVDERDGQWDDDAVTRTKGRPRYTLDKVNPIVNQIAGRMSQADFNIKVDPAGGEASKEIAKILDGIIRNIENISNSTQVYDSAAKAMVTSGLDGWEVVQDWAETDAFEQDLFIRPVANWLDSVWFDVNSQLQDRSDSLYAFKLRSFSQDAYDEKWPDGSGLSVSQGRQNQGSVNQPDNVIVGQIYYIKKVTRNIFKMSNGAVYSEDSEEYQTLKDELEAAGITIEDTRTRKANKVFVRQFDGGDWLNDEEEMVFNWIPLIPTYGNFKITANKVIYRGVVEKLMDPQRIYNYARSRQIEEGAFAPRDKYFMTLKQVEGFETEIATMNINNEPVQLYNHDTDAPPPYKGGPSQINQGLEATAAAAANDITQAAGLFSSNLGDNPGLQSGVAIDALKESGDIGTIEYFQSQEIAICHTAKILIDAIPKVYDTERQVRVLNEDGSFDVKIINENKLIMRDDQTGEMVMLNDLSKGRYDVTCTVGKSFSSRQEESVASILEVAPFAPEVITRNLDIFLSNSNAPGLDLAGERARAALFNAGEIPEPQWTDEERAQVQQAQQQAQDQPPQEDPLMVAARAEEGKAQAELQNAANKQTEIHGNQQISMAKIQLENKALDLKDKELDLDTQKFLRSGDAKFNVDLVKADQNQQKIDLDAQQQQFDQQNTINQNIQQQLNDAIANIKGIREGMGMDAFVGPHLTQAAVTQAVQVTELQEQSGADTEIGELVAGTEE